MVSGDSRVSSRLAELSATRQHSPSGPRWLAGIRRRILDHRKPYPENRSAIGGFGGNRAVMGLDNRTHDGQTQPDARTVRSGGVRAGEPLKQSGHKIRVDAGPIVGRGQFRAAIFPFSGRLLRLTMRQTTHPYASHSPRFGRAKLGHADHGDNALSTGCVSAPR